MLLLGEACIIFKSVGYETMNAVFNSVGFTRIAL